MRKIIKKIYKIRLFKRINFEAENFEEKFSPFLYFGVPRIPKGNLKYEGGDGYTVCKC